MDNGFKRIKEGKLISDVLIDWSRHKIGTQLAEGLGSVKRKSRSNVSPRKKKEGTEKGVLCA